jgi:hypothetical protein
MLAYTRYTGSTGVDPTPRGRRPACLPGKRGDDLYCDGLTVPPAMAFCNAACPGNELLSCALLGILTACAAAGFLQYLDKHRTVKNDHDFPVPSRDVTNQTLPGRE